MARDGRTLPARRQREAFDDSVLLRSAETLGRMIGTLQRQLNGAAKKLGNGGAFSSDGESGAGKGATAKATSDTKRVRAVAGAAKGGSKSGATKTRSTADRTSKRASKSAAAKKTAGRSRSGASRKSKRSGTAS